ncbi:MAG: DUF2760 domain-containing protein [Polyangiaceae bacterium]|nr:DUF2760 domain-containing protein [Polyangiaceae bacterium]
MPSPSLGRRLSLALSSFFRIVSDAEFASRVLAASDPAPELPPPSVPPATLASPGVSQPPPAPTRAEGAVSLLALLQRRARFVDFVEEDIASYSDADVGAAARAVHDGCREVIREHFTLSPARDEPEGAAVTVEEGYDAARVKLTGAVGKPPWRGVLRHRGWVVSSARLPELLGGADPSVVAPAEVEA